LPCEDWLIGILFLRYLELEGQKAEHWWLTPVILAPQEAEIRRIMVQSQPGQIVHETLSCTKPFTKKGW
jgi:hypothetical protein